MKKESEKLLEKKLRERVKACGGMCIKLVACHLTGLPDRLCILPGGRVSFVEVKTTGEKPRKIQKVMHDKIRGLGVRVYVVDSTESLEEILYRL